MSTTPDVTKTFTAETRFAVKAINALHSMRQKLKRFKDPEPLERSIATLESLFRDEWFQEGVGVVAHDVVFNRHSILPLETKRVYTLNRAVVKGSTDHVLRIRVMEGSGDSIPAACDCVGELRISGGELQESLYKGDDIEIELRLDENRDLHVDAHLPRIDQSFAEVWRGGLRHVNLGELREQIEELREEVTEELDVAEQSEDYERARGLKEMHRRADAMSRQLLEVTEEDGTDIRYKLDNEKHELAAVISRISADKKLREAWPAPLNLIQSL